MSKSNSHTLVKLSKILFIIYPLVIGYKTFIHCKISPCYCFGLNIYNILFDLPLYLAVVLALLSVVILKKKKLLNKELIKNLSLYFLFSIVVGALLLSMVFVSLCGSIDKAHDARKLSALRMIYEKQKDFYENNSRYAHSLEELLDEDDDFIINDVNNFNIVFEGGDNSDNWKAYSLKYIAEHEICGNRADKFLCDKTGCREE